MSSLFSKFIHSFQFSIRGLLFSKADLQEALRLKKVYNLFIYPNFGVWVVKSEICMTGFFIFLRASRNPTPVTAHQTKRVVVEDESGYSPSRWVKRFVIRPNSCYYQSMKKES